MDTFGHNPYPDNAAEPPWIRHGDPETVGQGDLDRLLRAIVDAFSGTPQRLPGEARTTVWYLETGFQTTVPRGKKRFYTGAETDSYVVPPMAPEHAEPWVRDQAGQLRDALLLARCQPAVGAFSTSSSSMRTVWPGGSPVCSGGMARRSRRTMRSRTPLRSCGPGVSTVRPCTASPARPSRPRSPATLGPRSASTPLLGSGQAHR